MPSGGAPLYCEASCPAGFFASSGSQCQGECLSHPACSAHCEQCSSASACSLCAAGHFLLGCSCVASCPDGYAANSSSRECEACTPYKCLTCPADKAVCTSCAVADRYYLQQASSTCAYCATPSTVQATQCVACPSVGYFTSEEGECVELCGDGIRFAHACDDGNTEDGDGCSSECAVESGFSCSGGSSSSPDLCYFVRPLRIASLLIQPDSYVLRVELTEPVEDAGLTRDKLSFTFDAPYSEADFKFELQPEPGPVIRGFSVQLDPKLSILEGRVSDSPDHRPWASILAPPVLSRPALRRWRCQRSSPRSE